MGISPEEFPRKRVPFHNVRATSSGSVNMNRRELLHVAALSGLSMTTAASHAAENPAATPGAAAKHVHEAPSPYRELVTTSSACVRTGDVCLSHCLTLLGEGDTELAACARTVRDTIAACGALQQLAAANSPHVRELAKVVALVCADCQAECHKHEQHPVCRDCEKACQDCKQACDKAAV
jgi:Cys-rich four helix bundle protein (predicted Tat secretion target)